MGFKSPFFSQPLCVKRGKNMISPVLILNYVNSAAVLGKLETAATAAVHLVSG